MSGVADLVLTGLGKSYGGQAVLADVSLTVAAGAYVVLLGPSGSGKTTLLSILGGFTAPTTGSVRLGAKDITAVPPAARPTATVFQDYALFPHLTVAQNVGFGLSVRHRPKAEIAARVEAALAMVDLAGFGPRRISAASGGQRQRIALARALVTDPAILLLDEPLGALDLNLRRQMQAELRALQQSEGRTFIHVTHDQEEAMALADLIVIMNRGRIEDMGPPEQVYSRPRTRFSASFMGESTLLPARFADGMAETPIGRLPAVNLGGQTVAIRPESLRLVPGPGDIPLGPARITARSFQGSHATLSLRIGETLLTLRAVPDAAPSVGSDRDIFLAANGAVPLMD